MPKSCIPGFRDGRKANDLCLCFIQHSESNDKGCNFDRVIALLSLHMDTLIVGVNEEQHKS